MEEARNPEAGNPEAEISMKKPENKGTEGMLKGVILPSLQATIGVILFLRMSWITGECGIMYTLIILSIAKMSTILTAMSMAAILTNEETHSGGAYRLLAKSLGPAFGGSIGIFYYLAICSNVAFYILAGVSNLIDEVSYQIYDIDFDIRFLSLTVLLIIFTILAVETRLLYVECLLFGVLGLCILSIIMGLLIDGLNSSDFSDNFITEYDNTKFEFSTLLAIFYPAVIGIMTGINRIDHVKNPNSNIPRGTLISILTLLVLYALLICLFGAAADRATLREEKFFAAIIAWPFHAVVSYGIMMVALGVAISSFSSAGDILLSISDDRIFSLLGYISTKERSLKATSIIVAGFILIGDVDYAAITTTMCFLLFYCCINIACCLLAWLDNPSWRPQWKYFRSWTALLGALICLGIMLWIKWWIAGLIFIAAVLLYTVIDLKIQNTNWGDAITGLKMQIVKKALLGIDTEGTQNLRNWVPQILIIDYLNDNSKPKNPGLLELANFLKHGNGFTIYGAIKIIPEISKKELKEKKESKRELQNYLREHRYEFDAKVIARTDINEAVAILLEGTGLGALEPNTVLIGWPMEWNGQVLRKERFMEVLNYSESAGFAVLVAKDPDHFTTVPENRKYLDIWWLSSFGSDFLYMLAHLLTKHENWSTKEVRIFHVYSELDDTKKHEMKEKLEKWTKQHRFFERCKINYVYVDQDALLLFKADREVIQMRKSLAKVSAAKILMEIEEENLSEGARDLMDSWETNDITNGILLNRKLIDNLIDSALTIMSLPSKPPSMQDDKYLTFIENLTKGIRRVLLVKATETSIINDPFS